MGRNVPLPMEKRPGQRIHFLRTPPQLFQQSPTSATVIHETHPFCFSAVHRDPRYRILVSQIDSNENVIHHVTASLLSKGLALFYSEPVPRLAFST